MSKKRILSYRKSLTSTSRADLLLLLRLDSQIELNKCSELFGFVSEKKLLDLNKKKIVTDKNFTDGSAVKQTKILPRQLSGFIDQSFFRITGYDVIDTKSSDTAILSELENIEPIDDDGETAFTKIYKPMPLVPWPKIWPFLRCTLGRPKNTRRLDINKITNKISNLQVIHKIDYEQRIDWADAGQLIIDYNRRMQVFYEDMNALRDEILEWRGKNGLEVLLIEESVGMSCVKLSDKKFRGIPYHPPVNNQPIMILSDMGLYNKSDEIVLRWLSLGKRFQRQGIKPVVLVPASDVTKLNSLKLYYHIVCWDRGVPIRLNQTISKMSAQRRLCNLKNFMSLLIPFVRVEAVLLRAVRLLFPCKSLTAAEEVAVWCHDDVYSEEGGFCFIDKDSNLNQYKENFKKLPHDLIKRIPELLKQYHAWLPKMVRVEEWKNLYTLIRELIADNKDEHEKIDFREFDDEIKTGIQDAQYYLKQIAGILYRYQDDKSKEHIRNWGHRFGRRFRFDEWQFEWARAIFALSNKDLIDNNKFGVLPEGLSVEQLRVYLDGDRIVNQNYELYQCGEKLIFTPIQEKEQVKQQGNRIITLNFDVDILNQQRQQGKNIQNFPLKLDDNRSVTIPLYQNERLTLSTRTESFTIESFEKPHWASQIGVDQYGLYADLIIKNITQRMRWINPGKFMMGSPESEPERYEDEQQHEVILTQGYWLADTTCTQALWKAVMKKNPSNFKEDEKPVEKVSWNDCQDFLKAVKRQIGKIDLRLPSEAEWEYACRAGTTTPFSFGGNITPEQVNYDGCNPYNKGEKGKYREETVPVKSLPINQWGLYEMHGNVWEWCSDWWRDDYEQDDKENPQGPPSGGSRVVRGGSWYDFGRVVRSACRGWNGPDGRDDYTGFRLALGQSSSGRGSA